MQTFCQDASLRFNYMRDEEVVVFARTGHDRATEYLMTKYRHLVESKARSYFLAGLLQRVLNEFRRSMRFQSKKA